MELSTQDRCIHLANGGMLRWHTPLSPDHSIGEDYAKMKAEPCKIVETYWRTPGPKKKPWKMKQRKPKMKVNTYMELSTQDKCINPANGGTLSWHTPLSRPFNRGRLCKNEGRTMQNCRNILEDSRTQEKTMENEAAQAKNEGQHIHGAFHTRQMYKSCKWGHAKLAHTSLQAIQSGKTMQKCRQDHAKLWKTHWRTQGKNIWSDTSQEWRSKHTWSFPIQDRCILLASGGVSH